MLRTFHRSQKGFTLIELMIVVVIIGILAALAIPRFMRATTKSKQSEAKQILKQIYTMQHAYRQEHDLYTDFLTQGAGGAFPNIGVEVMATARYTYAMTTTDGGVTTFLCTATANLDDDATIDTWTISQTGQLIVTIDDAVN